MVLRIVQNLSTCFLYQLPGWSETHHIAASSNGLTERAITLLTRACLEQKPGLRQIPYTKGESYLVHWYHLSFLVVLLYNEMEKLSMGFV